MSVCRYAGPESLASTSAPLKVPLANSSLGSEKGLQPVPLAGSFFSSGPTQELQNQQQKEEQTHHMSSLESLFQHHCVTPLDGKNGKNANGTRQVM